MHELTVMDKEKEHMSRLKDAVDMKVEILILSEVTWWVTWSATSVLLCSAENSGGADGEPQRGSPEAAESPPRRDRAEAQTHRAAQRVGDGY